MDPIKQTLRPKRWWHRIFWARQLPASRNDCLVAGTLPEPLRALIQRQEMGVQRNHDQIKALRDRIKSNV